MEMRAAFWRFSGFLKLGGVPNWEFRRCEAGWKDSAGASGKRSMGYGSTELLACQGPVLIGISFERDGWERSGP